jgi:Dual-action HEIGH metallo-peptidase
VWVGRDAMVSLDASREMIAVDGSSTHEQFRTTNLVGAAVATICVDGSRFKGVFSTALDDAIGNYNALGLSFTMVRTRRGQTGCDAVITGSISGPVGGSSGFPSNGLPFGSFQVGSGLKSFDVNTIEHVITHELGHTVGFRHSDFFNRSISCGGGAVNEGDGGIGAILIPGTPSGAVVGGSIMNSCFRTLETGEFTDTDIIALNALY